MAAFAALAALDKPRVMYGFPVICRDGQYSIVPDLEISPFSREKMEITYWELVEERDSVRHLL